jgi:hypothetical protein
VKEDRIIRDTSDLKEIMNGGHITASKTTEAAITDPMITVQILTEIDPADPEPMTIVTEETTEGITTITVAAEDTSTATAEEGDTATTAPITTTVPRMVIQAITTARMETTGTTGTIAPSTVRAPKEGMTTGQPRLIRLRHRETSCPETD